MASIGDELAALREDLDAAEQGRLAWRVRAEAAEAKVARVSAAMRLLSNTDLTPQAERILHAALDGDS